MFRVLETRRPRLLLVLFCLALWTPGFFTLPPGDRDESRFAQASKQMLESGDFVRIQNGTEARNRKPIGIYWLQAASAAAAHAAELGRENPIWPYRVPSALGALVAVLGTHALGLRLAGRGAALLGAAFLAASVILGIETHIAKTDAALTGSVVLAMGVLGRAYLTPLSVGVGHAALFWLALGASILLKGPIGPMVVGLTAVTLGVSDRRWRWLGALRPGWGVPLMVAAVLPWFVAIGVATQGRFFADAIGGDLGRKIASGDDAHWGPPGLHLLLAPVLLLPAAAALPGAVRRAWRERATPATRFLLAWIVPSWLVFEAAPTKLPHYTLPLYPALCLLAAAWLLRRDRAAMGRAALLPAVVAVLLGAALAAAPVLLQQEIWLGAPAAVAALLLAAAFAALLRRRAWEAEVRLALGALACMPVFYWAAFAIELPRLAPLWIAPRVAMAVPPGRLGAVGFAEPSLMFLAGTATEFFSATAAPDALAAGEVTTLLVGDRDLPAVLDALRARGIETVRVADIAGFNYSRGRFVTLTALTLLR